MEKQDIVVGGIYKCDLRIPADMLHIVNATVVHVYSPFRIECETKTGINTTIRVTLRDSLLKKQIGLDPRYTLEFKALENRRDKINEWLGAIEQLSADDQLPLTTYRRINIEDLLLVLQDEIKAVQDKIDAFSTQPIMFDEFNLDESRAGWAKRSSDFTEDENS